MSDPSRIDEEFRKAWLPYFCRSGQREASLEEFDHEVEGWLPLLPEVSLPCLTGQMLADVVRGKGATAGSLDGWGWRELKVLPVSWYDGLARILSTVEDTGVWPDGLLDAYIAMIPKTDGDATPLGQRPLSVLPVVYRVWASTRMGQLGDWFKSWVPDSVFSAGGGRGSVEAWYTSSLEIEEVLAGVADSHVHLFVADVVKSFDTVDRSILDRVLSSLGLPGWFRHAYFEYHAHVRLRFKLASGLGEPWTRDGGIPQGCPLSMMFIVALYLPWCRYLSARVGVQPQLYADNLKCVSHDPDSLLAAARFTTGYVRLVGQEPAPSKCVLLSTSREVRHSMRDWLLSQEGDQWSVKFDVRDLGGHLDTTFRGWSSTLAARVRLVLSRLILIFALPLDFHGRIRVVRSMYIPAALHGIEASLLASDSLRKLRSAICRVVWSHRQPLANVGAVLSLLDGPTGCDPAFCVVWFRFRLLRRYLALWPAEVGRVYRLLEMVGNGCPGHGPIHLLCSSAARIGFWWNPVVLAWERPGLPVLSHIAGPIQHFRSAVLDAWRNKVAGDLCARQGFRGGPLLDVHGSLQLLNSSHVRERDKGLLRSVMVGGVWNGFLLGRVRNQVVPCRFCGAPDHDGHLFWECTFPPLVEIRENPEFHDLMRMDKAHWPRCLLWHGWLPMLSGCNGDSPWAGTAAESAHYLVEAALGGYSSALISAWSPPDGFDQSAVSCLVPDHPNIWTDGSLVLDKVAGISSSGAGFFAHQAALLWDVRTWGQVDRLQSVGDFPTCRGFCSVPGPYQSVQRAEMWGVILALQSSGAVHLGVDNLGVVRHVGRLLDGCPGSVPFELLKDGDLLLLIDRMIRRRGADTVRVSKVKGHADEVMVRSGQVREVDRLGNNAADEAADFGRRRVGDSVIDARRNLSGVCNRWYPVILDLHRFFIAVSRAVVNYDGGPGTAPDPLVWSAGALPKRRRLVHAVRDRAFLPGPPGLWDSDWVNIPASLISAADIALWPYTTGLLVKWVSFLASLHWPAGGSDLGVGGISYVELLILYELWAGERLSLEKATPRYLRQGRSISVSAVPFGPGIDIWRSCRFLGALMRSLCLLPGGLGRFVPCSIGANHCRLRHIGWEKCGHGLTSRPRESASAHFLDELLALFRYPPGSGHALLAGTLPLRYCSTRFACMTPSWRLPALGSVRSLVAAYSDGGHLVGVDEVGRDVCWVSGSGPGRKRIRLIRKTPAHLAGYVTHSRPKVWKRLRHVGFHCISDSDHKRRRCEQNRDGVIPSQDRTGVG